MCSAGKMISSTADAEAPAKKQRLVGCSGRAALAAVNWASVREHTFPISQKESRPRKAQGHLETDGTAPRQPAASGQSISEVQPPGNSQVHQPDHGWLVQPAAAAHGTHNTGVCSSQAPGMSSNEQPGDKVWQGASVEHPATPLEFRRQHGKEVSRWEDFQDDEASAYCDDNAGVADDSNIGKPASGRWLTNSGMQQCSSLHYESMPHLTTSYD